MIAVDLGRRLALLGAESHVAAGDEATDPSVTWSSHEDRWAALRAELASGHEDPWRDRLAALGLANVDVWVVALCLAAELYSDAAAALSILAEDERVHLPTPLSSARLLSAGLGLDYHELLGQLCEGGRAVELGLLESVEVVSGRPSTWRALRIPAARLPVVLGLREHKRVDAHVRVEPLACSVYPEAAVAAAAELLVEQRCLCLRSPSSRAGRQFAIDLARELDRSALLLTVGQDPADGPSAPRFDAFELLGASGMSGMSTPGECVTIVDLTAIERERAGLAVSNAVARLGARVDRLVLLAPSRTAQLTVPTIDVPPLTSREATRAWRLHVDSDEQAAALARQFRVSAEDVRAAVDAARYRKRMAGDQDSPIDLSSDSPSDSPSASPSVEEIGAEVLAQGSRAMGSLVSHLRSKARLDHLVVPLSLRHELDDIVGWYRSSARVYDDMGMQVLSSEGRGLTCLFSGQPGTGKTFAAHCLANELGLNLYRIDLSQVVSKYIGETEKSLARVFDESESGHGILLFDEADALFGKRSQVKDAHDRHANIEVSYLLQRLDSFDGIAILTTNLRGNMDPAFVRRLRFVLEFPIPDVEQRRKLWRGSLPALKYVDEQLELGPFAERFALTGGNIHNIGLAAAHMAAATKKGRVTTAQLVRATLRELEKIGGARSAAVFGPLAEHLPGRSSS